jgi:hypothetical protein
MNPGPVLRYGENCILHRNYRNRFVGGWFRFHPSRSRMGTLLQDPKRRIFIRVAKAAARGLEDMEDTEHGARLLWWASPKAKDAGRRHRDTGAAPGQSSPLQRARSIRLQGVDPAALVHARGDAMGVVGSAGGAQRDAWGANIRRESHLLRPRETADGGTGDGTAVGLRARRRQLLCGGLPRQHPPLAAALFLLAALLLQLTHCDGFRGRAGPSTPPPMLHHWSDCRHAMEPEYVCVYDYMANSVDHQIGAAITYKQYLADRNSELRGQVLAAAGPLEHARQEGTKGGRVAQRAVLTLRNSSVFFDLNHDLALGSLRGAEARARENHWRHDVGQRYKELIPPNHPVPCKQGMNASRRIKSKHRMLSVDDMRKAAEAALSTSNSVSWSPRGEHKMCGREKVTEAVLVLDLDKCSFWGSDANDLGIALQWMEKGPELVLELYRLLLNPQVKATYARLKERAKKVRVVIYTMRATFLVYHSCFRDQTLPLRWDASWHHGAQIFIPPAVQDAETIIQSYSMKAPLLPEEQRDLKKSFERLLATRAVLAEELALESLPELIITASPKDVEGSMRHLRIPVENAYLWDDNVKLRDNTRVVNVPHFDALPPPQHAALMQFLDEHCPALSLEEDLLDFMLGADPADVVIAPDEETGFYKYQIPMCHSVGQWSLPCLVTTTMCHDRATKGLAAMDGKVQRWGGASKGRGVAEGEVLASNAKANGHLSPVTPECELFAWGGEGGEAVSYDRGS